MPGPVRPEVDEAIAHHAPPPTVPQSFKTSGSIGEVLESDLYAFKLIAMRPCGDTPTDASDPRARTVIGAEVEITAKTKLMLSPKHVSLVKGGITFFGNVDLKRNVKGCTRLIPVSVMKQGDVAKGFVLFDLPVSGPGSNWKEFSLVYLPARFGGAPQVLVKLEGS